MESQNERITLQKSRWKRLLPEKWDRIVHIYLLLFYYCHFTAFETHLTMYLLFKVV
jgi:hypothetical protein